MTAIKLEKIKRPAGAFTFEVWPMDEDQFGFWFSAPRGSRWRGPGTEGHLPFDTVLLLNPGSFWIPWWVDGPEGKRVAVDVCLAPERTRDGWRYIDLELDPVRRENGIVEVEDRDEFEMACSNGWISPEESQTANATAAMLEDALRRSVEPFGETGWRRLALLRKDESR
jgi:hypothetical protein